MVVWPFDYSVILILRFGNQALVHVGRANRSGQLQRSGYQDEIPKTADKMMALMAIATSLAPGAKIDEQVRLAFSFFSGLRGWLGSYCNDRHILSHLFVLRGP